MEDIGIALGDAGREGWDRNAAQPRRHFVMPMDGTLAVAALDLSGRPLSASICVEGSVVGDRSRARSGFSRV